MTDEYDSWRRYEDAKAFKNKLAEIDRLKDRIEKLEAALREVLSLGDWGANILARCIMFEALETTDCTIGEKE